MYTKETGVFNEKGKKVLDLVSCMQRASRDCLAPGFRSRSISLSKRMLEMIKSESRRSVG